MVGRMRAPLYALQLALLTTHPADAAYQHEWRALGVPGGVDGFLAFNLVAVAALAWGAIQLGRTHSRRWTAACALTGVLTGLIHGGLWLGGGSEFTTLPSRALIAAIVLVAALQLGELGRATPAPPPT
jgi:hypothetical protein